MSIHYNISLKGLTTFNVDYKAKYFLEIKDSNFLYDELYKNNLLDLEKIFLGEGSNLLFTRDYPGVVIKVKGDYIKIEKETSEEIYITVSGNFKWHNFVTFCVERNFYGVENLALIPGSVGGAVVQNIGAYGVEVKTIIEKVICIDILSGKEKVFSKEECDFNYRSSLFKRERNLFVKESTFILSKIKKLNLSYPGLKDSLKKISEELINAKDVFNAVCSIRRLKIPDPLIFPNAGSFFKNPIIEVKKFEKLKTDYPELVFFPLENNFIKLSAGWLIEKVNLKGKVINGAGTSPNHALVLIKYAEGKGEDVLNFANLIEKKVFEKFLIKLEREVEVI